MSNILVACHCKNKLSDGKWNDGHPSLLMKELGKPIKPISSDTDFLDIDSACPNDTNQYKDWSRVPDASKDFIYTINCSLYAILSYYHKVKKILVGEGKGLLINLINDGWRILRPGGIIIIPTFKDNLLTELTNLKAAVNDLGPSNQWIITTKKSHEIPFILIEDKKNSERRIYTHFLVMMKPVVGGSKSKRNRTRRKSKPKRKTYKNKSRD